MIDRLYGANFWKSTKLNMPLTKLIIDCRDLHKSPNICVQLAVKQIQQTYDMNWLSGSPFEIFIANFFVSDTIDRAIRKYWYFLYGPPFYQYSDHCKKNTSENFDKINDRNDYVPMTFIPTITTRGIWSVLGNDIKPDEVAYISSKAKSFLDTVLVDNRSKKNLTFKAFVVSAYDNPFIPWQHSISAAVVDKIPSFRLPFDKYIICNKKNNTLPVYTIASILRFVNNYEYSWDYTIKHHFKNTTNENKNKTFNLEDNALKLVTIEKRKRRVQLLEEIEKQQYNKIFTKEKTIENLPNGKKIFQKRRHKYSREERNQMKKPNNC